jgi:hypothetical protein
MREAEQDSKDHGTLDEITTSLQHRWADPKTGTGAQRELLQLHSGTSIQRERGELSVLLSPPSPGPQSQAIVRRICSNCRMSLQEFDSGEGNCGFSQMCRQLWKYTAEGLLIQSFLHRGKKR